MIWTEVYNSINKALSTVTLIL